MALTIPGVGTVKTTPVSGEHEQEIRPAGAATATVTRILADDTSAKSVAGSTPNRLGLMVYNDTVVDFYIKLGATPSATSFSYRIRPGQLWELPPWFRYTGTVTGYFSDVDDTRGIMVTEG
jgi:hypothetical protein